MRPTLLLLALAGCVQAGPPRLVESHYAQDAKGQWYRVDTWQDPPASPALDVVPGSPGQNQSVNQTTNVFVGGMPDTFAPPPSAPKAPVYVQRTYAQPQAAPVYVQPTYAVRAPVVYAAPAKAPKAPKAVAVYQVPVAAPVPVYAPAPVYAIPVRAPKTYATPIRSFLFGH